MFRIAIVLNLNSDNLKLNNEQSQKLAKTESNHKANNRNGNSAFFLVQLLVAR